MNHEAAAATITVVPALAATLALALAISPLIVAEEVEDPAASAVPRPRVSGPIYLESQERSAIPRRLGYRGTTVGIGGAIRFDTGCPADGSSCAPEWDRTILLATPTFDLLTELGWRYVRVVIGVFVAPIPHENTDFHYGLLVGAQGGLLLGYERFRAGVTVGGGYLGSQVLARLMVTPWRDRFGHRHGFEAAVGRENYREVFLFAYRFAPAALNHVGGRRAARERAARR